MYKVLIADDEHTIREGLTHFVLWHELDCEVVCLAANGVEALEHVRSNTIDIAILDIKMPGIDGLELLRIISKEQPHIRCIILTAHTEFAYVHKALRLSAFDYVEKLNFELELPEVVKRAISDIAKNAKRYDAVEPSSIHRALKFVEQNFSDKISLNYVSENVFLNKSYLSRAFKQEIGLSITEEINRLRIEKAQKLLKQNMRICDVAEQVGFSDPSYFTRVFKKVVGVNPSEYVQMNTFKK